MSETKAALNQTYLLHDVVALLGVLGRILGYQS